MKEVGDYIIDRTINNVLFCDIKHGIHKADGHEVAIKVIDKNRFYKKADAYCEIRQNLAIFSLIDHPHAIKLFEVFESSHNLYIILEYASHGNMYDFLNKVKRIQVHESLRLFREIIYGLEYIHSHKIYFEELTLGNVFLDEFDHVKLNVFYSKQLVKPDPCAPSCSCPNFLAPEVILGKKNDPICSDIWTCGVILYTFLTGNYPFDDYKIHKLLRLIKEGRFIMPDVPVCIQDLLSRMLTVSVTERITMEEIKKHPAFRFGLPDGYVVPTPFRFSPFKDPIDPSNVDPKIKQIIWNIGYINDEEINEEFTSFCHTTSKVFYLMLNKNASYNLIQWKESDQVDTCEFFTPIMNNHKIGAKSIQNELFDKIESSKIRFLIQKPLVNVRFEQAIECETIQLQYLMKELQDFLTKNNFKWLHQSDMELLSKSLNSDLFVLFTCSFQSMKTIILKLSLIQGNEDEFAALKQKVQDCISFLLQHPISK